MFEKTRNIERSFRHIRLFCIVLVVGSILGNVVVAVRFLQAEQRMRNTIYVLSAGKVFQAFAELGSTNIPIEARDHIRTFHRLFYTLSPDEKAIRSNLTAALYLADGSAKKAYNDLKEGGYYAGVISGNITQSIITDSVSVDTDHYPFYFRCWSTLTIARPTSVVTRSLVTEGYLTHTDRSDNVPHGFMIERWAILDRKDVKVESR